MTTVCLLRPLSEAQRSFSSTGTVCILPASLTTNPCQIFHEKVAKKALPLLSIELNFPLSPFSRVASRHSSHRSTLIAAPLQHLCFSRVHVQKDLLSPARFCRFMLSRRSGRPRKKELALSSSLFSLFFPSFLSYTQELCIILTMGFELVELRILLQCIEERASRFVRRRTGLLILFPISASSLVLLPPTFLLLFSFLLCGSHTSRR